MAAQKGSLVLLKVGNGGAPESFTTIGGLQTTAFAVSTQAVDATARESGAWRKLLDGAGIRSISLSANGVFTDSSAEETVRSLAISGTVRNYQMTFGNGDTLSGPFLITAYERSGAQQDEERYALTLFSAGTIIYST